MMASFNGGIMLRVKVVIMMFVFEDEDGLMVMLEGEGGDDDGVVKMMKMHVFMLLFRCG